MDVSRERDILAAQMKNNYFLIALLGLILSLTLQKGCTGNLKPARGPSEGISTAPKNTLAWATERINSSCPVWVDEDSRLDSVILSPDKQIVYYYTLPFRKKADIHPTAFEAYLMPRLIENIHYNAELKMHRDSSVTVVFNYTDQNGELITEFSVGPEYYK